jgi:hypothetical protein
MLTRISRRCRFGLLQLIAPLWISLPCLAIAGEIPGQSDCVPKPIPVCTQDAPACEELCGWVEMGTHDTPTDGAADGEASDDAAMQGVAVEQVVEPFAFVSSYLKQSRSSVERFQQWWEQALAQSRAIRDAEIEFAEQRELQTELNTLAAQEPIDVNGLGESVLVEAFPRSVAEVESIVVTEIDPLVGSSPMIATIEDAYLPYDLSTRDMKVWSVFPLATRPLCVRSHTYAAPLWDDFDQLVEQRVDARPATMPQAVWGSADCYLDECLWRIESMITASAPLRMELDAVSLGGRAAKLVLRGHRLAQSAAQVLASVWPAASDEAQDVSNPDGEALLARAGAIVASEPVRIAATAQPESPEGQADAVSSLR